VLLQSVTDRGKGPEVVAEKLLEGTDGDPGVEGQRLTGLAREVGEKAAAVDLKQLKGLRVATAEEELLQVVGKSGSQSNNLFSSHRNTSGLTQRYEEHFAHQLVKIRSAVVLGGVNGLAFVPPLALWIGYAAPGWHGAAPAGKRNTVVLLTLTMGRGYVEPSQAVGLALDRDAPVASPVRVAVGTADC